MAHHRGDDGAVDVALLQPRRERAAQVVRRHAWHAGAQARAFEVSADVAPGLDDRAARIVQRLEPRPEHRVDRHLARLRLPLRDADLVAREIDVLLPPHLLDLALARRGERDQQAVQRAVRAARLDARDRLGLRLRVRGLHDVAHQLCELLGREVRGARLVARLPAWDDLRDHAAERAARFGAAERAAQHD
ncbi:MAG TPA: hypothetical protein VGF94_19160 [Kofleriaceae bacterium]